MIDSQRARCVVFADEDSARCGSIISVVQDHVLDLVVSTIEEPC